MNRAAAASLLLSCCATALAAQAEPPYEPTLAFSINVGLTSHKDLWSLPRQPQPAPGNAFDTLSLGRVIRPGLVAGVSATYYTSPRFGWTAEVTYFGIASEQRCSGPAAFVPDSLNLNQEACVRANGAHVNTSVVGFLLGATYRLIDGGRVQPFIRATAGPGIMGSSYVNTSGLVTAPSGCSGGCVYALFEEQDPAQFTFVANVSAGLTFKMSEAYRLRFEMHDVITQVAIATGPHPPSTTVGPTSKVVRHVPTLTFGLDLLLERRRGRRY